MEQSLELTFEPKYHSLFSNIENLSDEAQLELFRGFNEVIKIKLQNETREKLAYLPYKYQYQQLYTEIKISAMFGIIFSILTFIILTSLRCLYEIIIQTIKIAGQSIANTSNILETLTKNTQMIISYTGLINAPHENQMQYSKVILEMIHLFIISIDESSQNAKIACSLFIGLMLWLLLFIFLRILHTHISFGITGFQFKGFIERSERNK